jgi:thymidylate synthase (FAD)
MNNEHRELIGDGSGTPVPELRMDTNGPRRPQASMRNGLILAETHDPLGDGISLVELVDHMGDDLSVVRAARVSTARDDRTEGAEKLIRYMARHEHGTPFEHNAMTFRVKAPLFVIGQWHRHRVGWSYNQTSRRYTDENIEFYIPTVWRKQAETNKQASAGEFADDKNYWFAEKLSDICEDAESKYKFLLEQGVAREMARMILPQNLYASMYATCNLRSLAHFHKLRAAPEAQLEIRRYAEVMGEIAGVLFPMAWAALVEAANRKVDPEALICPRCRGKARGLIQCPECDFLHEL